MLSKLPNILALALALKSTLSLALPQARDSTKHATYFLQIDPAGDYVVALSNNEDNGTVSSPVRTPTGGKGLAGLLAISQDSLVVSQDYLFAVNPGDNTLSFFVINPEDPTHPTLVGKPADTLGETPVSVAYSPKLHTACALNSGATAGVTCFSVSSTKGLTPLGPLRPIPQTETSDPTPVPPGPLVIGQDIVFNPSSSAVFVTIRSNGAQPGLLYAYPVTGGQVSTSHTVSSLPTLPFAFSLDFLSSDTRVLITNPHLNSPGAAILSVAYPSLNATVSQTITIPDQMATCWVAYSPFHQAAFVIDALQPNITIVNTGTGDVEGVFHYPTGQFGGFDSMVQRKWLYTLSDDQTDPKIEVFDIEGVNNGKEPVLVQGYDLFEGVGGFAPAPSWMGLDVYPSQRG